MTILVIDVGGNEIKLKLSSGSETSRIKTVPELVPDLLVEQVCDRAMELNWSWERMTLGVPAPVVRGEIVEEPANLARGWIGYDFEKAFDVPVKLINDAAMQALGSYDGGRMLFLGLGTGLGSALIDNDHLVSLEFGHLPYRDHYYEYYIGSAGREQLGRNAWREIVFDAVKHLKAAVSAEYVVIGGGAVELLTQLPPGARRGHNENAFLGGVRLWEQEKLETLRFSAEEVDLNLVWRTLGQHHEGVAKLKMRDIFSKDVDRLAKYSLEFEEIFLDFSKNRINDKTMILLRELARVMRVRERRDAMYAGKRINLSEDRAVFHVGLRDQSDRPLTVDGEDQRPDIEAALTKLSEFSERVRSKEWLGYTGKPVTDVVNIGIGGSYLGPAFVTEALRPYHDGPHVHFLSNVDGHPTRFLLDTLDPATTLFIIASKTFSTVETMTNARTARDWFLESASPDDVAKHFVAVSTQEDRVRDFGIDPENMFVFWDWVGGRYSLWSSIGLPVAIAVGPEKFRELLRGAHAMDRHFRTAPFDKNLPLTLALIEIWYNNFFGAQSQAILPYDHRLARFPEYLQQADMESNGKRVSRDGTPVRVETGPVIFGEVGTDSQHAFFQLLHQGTKLVPADFILCAQPDHDQPHHHALLVANCFAQTEALMRGRTEAEARAELEGKGLPQTEIERFLPHRVFPGNRPSNTILLKRLNPYNLGSLIALYEHKIFCMGTIWNINSFDQWGVELGKQLATEFLPAVESRDIAEVPESSRGLIAQLIKYQAE